MMCLLKIFPEWAAKILSGEKKYEYRKRRPEWLGTGCEVALVDANDCDKLLGSFVVSHIIDGSPTTVWQKTNGASVQLPPEYLAYYEQSDTAYAIGIEKPRHPIANFSVKSLLDERCNVASFTRLSEMEAEIIRHQIAPVGI